jgi:Ca2+-binding RTX toxin-like protein
MMQLTTSARLAFTALLGALAILAVAATHAPAAPSCEEGPETVGETIVGTPCDDTIRAPRGVTTVLGEGGNDTLYGQRGNDSLFGGDGDDRLYGGVGDDRLRAGPGADLLSGGFGADSLDGEGGGDIARGDATIDAIADTGSDGATDTLSYATGVTPGFPNQGSFFDYEGFPSGDNGRGAYIDLGQGFGNDGLAPAGGGVDLELEGTSFEQVIGTPFPDFIVGTGDAETIYGGGGADVLLGEGGGDHLVGGAEGDSCDGPGASIECESGGNEVDPRDPGAIAVGLMTPVGAGPPALYLTGSNRDDEVTAEYGPGTVTFKLGGGSEGAFDPVQSVEGGCSSPTSGKVTCPTAAPPDSIVLAGLQGDDSLSAPGFPETTSVIVLGGENADTIAGGTTEDALVDGPGNDLASAAAGDDAVPNNAGTDSLHAGPGDDLFISNSVCEGDVLDGGPDRDNANWANFGSAISIDMSMSRAGLVGPTGQPECASDALRTNLEAIEDIEGTSFDDTLVGDPGENQLLGRFGHDSYFAAGGNDSILANSGDEDRTIDCGEGFDTAQVDHPQYGDPTPVSCEAVHERDPNSFRPPDTPPDPNPPTEAAAPPPPAPVQAKPPRRRPPDRVAPRTTVLREPERLLFTRARLRRVVFAFASNESGSTFRCKLDRAPFRPCRSPRAYRLGPGRHAFRVFAVDRAGNRDASPALFRFQLRRR